MKITISEISVGKRFRQEMGNLKELADNIEQQGLLQPIGLTENKELVFGERRLQACRDILGWTEIDARVVNVTSMLEGEWSENELREDWTVSERVAIMRALQEQIGDRQGQRTDIGLVQNFVQVEPGQKTSDVAAQRAGFGNRETARQAGYVVDNAPADLVDAVDEGDVAVSLAAKALRRAAERGDPITNMKDFRKAVRETYREDNPTPAPQVSSPKPPLRDPNPITETWIDWTSAVKHLAQGDATDYDELAQALPAALDHLLEEAMAARAQLNLWIEALENCNVLA